MKVLRRKTGRAWNEPGHAHFLTYSCFRRWPLLRRERTRRRVIAALEDARRLANGEDDARHSIVDAR